MCHQLRALFLAPNPVLWMHCQNLYILLVLNYKLWTYEFRNRTWLKLSISNIKIQHFSFSCLRTLKVPPTLPKTVHMLSNCFRFCFVIKLVVSYLKLLWIKYWLNLKSFKKRILIKRLHLRIFLLYNIIYF